MLNKNEDKYQSAVQSDGDAQQAMLTTVETGNAANAKQFRRHRLGQTLRARTLTVGGWRVAIGFKF